jgi:hypothetical protein
MDGLPFDVAKPPKDMNERLDSAKATMISAGSIAAVNLGIFGGHVKTHGGAAATVVGAKASALKETI